MIRWGEIEGRLDPKTYHQDRLQVIEILRVSGVNLKPLKFLVSATKETVKSITSDEAIYVGLENVESDTGYYIPKTEKDLISSALVFKKGDILFPKLRPYLNKVFYATFDGICSTEFHVFKSTILNNEYLSHFLRSKLVVSQTEKLMSGNTLPRVQTEDIYNLLIPVISPEKQLQVTALMDKAREDSNHLKSEAEVLITSIDTYILNELGITLPERDTSMGARMFQTTFRQVSGRRFDPNNVLYRDYLEKCISRYNKIKLGDLILGSPQYGANEEAIKRESDNDIRYIRITDLDDYGQLKENDWKTAQETLDYYLLSKDDILFARSGSVGRCYLHKPIAQKAIFAGYLIRFITNKQRLLPEYLYYFTYTSYYKAWVQSMQRVAAQPNINAEEYKSFQLPLPPIEKQQEIIMEANRRRLEARRLSEEANKALEEARAEIERMILG
ncbi:MAG: restriction endonuclease subunit S [Ekhidna sp.]|nr:restriction endonuclease subunit S [Ekhidna sp.]